MCLVLWYLQLNYNTLNFDNDNGSVLIIGNNFPCPAQQSVTCNECMFLSCLDGKQNQSISHPVSFSLAFSVAHSSNKNTSVQSIHKGRGRMYLSYNNKLSNEKYQFVVLPCAYKHTAANIALIFNANCFLKFSLLLSWCFICLRVCI